MYALSAESIRSELAATGLTSPGSVSPGHVSPGLSSQELAVSRDLLVGIAPFLIGLVIVAMLIGAVVLGIRVKKREPPAPRPEEQPRAPERDHPPGVVHEHPESHELPQDGVRRTPHHLGGQGPDT
ncbi:DUF2207 domain-containing protein [Streptomyces sp. NBC_00237]|uniref:DUF6479 family protein n=1 Tax=Streptomyces sp. NBC_00237 TaxID=2975687 RepID=UPI00225927A3|nr:DUF6479 family protein [Streptomyces sp. NBC_00237]MCX5207364.1 DUF2207 domain-containing protein [Streptomyces sp. NBC_00237]